MVNIMQAITLKKYLAQLSLTTWMSFVGGAQSAVFTEFTQHKPSAWRIGFDIDFWAILYGGGCLWSDHINPTMVYRTEVNVESNLKNLAISGTHTHAGPAGYLQYVVYSVTSLGFVQQSFDAIVDAIEQSIVQAHTNLKPGSIFINTGDVENAGINRSPSAYLFNPAEERARYVNNTDTQMMGYASMSQVTAGVHSRLRDRAFIVAESTEGARFAFVNLDAGMASQLVTIKVLETLRSRSWEVVPKEIGPSLQVVKEGGGGTWVQNIML